VCVCVYVCLCVCVSVYLCVCVSMSASVSVAEHVSVSAQGAGGGAGGAAVPATSDGTWGCVLCGDEGPGYASHCANECRLCVECFKHDTMGQPVPHECCRTSEETKKFLGSNECMCFPDVLRGRVAWEKAGLTWRDPHRGMWGVETQDHYNALVQKLAGAVQDPLAAYEEVKKELLEAGVSLPAVLCVCVSVCLSVSMCLCVSVCVRARLVRACVRVCVALIRSRGLADTIVTHTERDTREARASKRARKANPRP
jgi:hypothetical protein